MAQQRKWITYLLTITLFVVGYFIGQMNIDGSSTIVGDANKYQQNPEGQAKKIKYGSVTSIERPDFKGNVLIVKDGESIQEAVNKAKPGDQIKVMPGTYKETVYIDKDDITLTGVIIKGEWPTLEGEHKLNDAILYSGNNFTVENFLITHYKGNGVMGQAGNNFIIRNLCNS